MSAPTVVIGATGTVGARVARALAARGVPVRALVRDAARARARLGRDGIELVVGDLADDAALRRALDGAAAAYLACANRPDQAELEIGAIDLAADAGVRRIVKLSALGAEAGSPVAFWDAHGRIERRLRATRAVSSVVLRPTYFMTNLLAAAAAVRQGGALAAPAGDARIAMIDPRDVAAAAVAALDGDRVACGTYELTGPAALTHAEAAAALAAAAGRPVAYVDVPDDAARRALEASGMGAWMAASLVRLFVELRRGVAARVTHGVADLTGHRPRPLAAFARRHAAAFGGEPSAATR